MPHAPKLALPSLRTPRRFRRMDSTPASLTAQRWTAEFQEGHAFRADQFLTPSQLEDQRNDEFYRLLKRHLHSQGAALETGFGYGNSCFLLATEGIASQVTGIDCVGELVASVKQHQARFFPQTQGHLEFVQADLFEYQGAPVDLVFSHGVYEHFLDGQERQRALAAFSRNLNADGRLLLVIPNLKNPLFQAAVRGGVPEMVALSLRQLSEEVRLSGFEIIETGHLFVAQGFEQWVSRAWIVPFLKVLGRLYPDFPRWLKRVLSVHQYCVARKRRP